MMSPSAVRVWAAFYCSIIAYCNADYITAYVKQYLITTTCVSVPRIRNVCNIDWKVRENDAKHYDELIENINATISMSVIIRGLSEGDAMHCRKMYENMMCRNWFPICDMKRLVIDHGDAKARCMYAKSACTTISIEGCHTFKNGVEPIITEPNKCEVVAANTSKLCPNVQVKVPNQYNVQTVKPIVERLSKTEEMFSKELKNHTITARCEMKYREVLCRLIEACSPDGFYYLNFINMSECERMISCVKSAGFSDEITSVCSKIPNTDDTEHIIVPNPARPEIPTTTATLTTSRKTNSTATTSRKTDATPITLRKTDHGNPVTDPSTDIVTSEILVQPTDENKNQVVSNNTVNSKKVKNSNPRGDASRNYQNLYIFSMVLALFVGQAVHQLP